MTQELFLFNQYNTPVATGRTMFTGNRVFGIDEMAQTPGVFSASPEWVMGKGGVAGDLTEEALALVGGLGRDDGWHWVVDMRVQRLMPGMYPSIPGWHCDNVPRSDYYAQPDLDALDPSKLHVVCTLSTSPVGVSNTSFLYTPNVYVPFTEEQKRKVWFTVHQEVEKRKGYDLQVHDVQDGEFTVFNNTVIHAAQPTHTRGWRIFFRLASHPTPPLEGGYKNAEQVYILSEANGW